jgi:anti-sigma28 factor (negative regulator of flagellin synthesis)
MRVENGAVDSLFSSSRSSAARGAGEESRVSTNTSNSNGVDFVSLSDATNLLALAKDKIPSDKQARLEAISGQIRSGTYQADTSDVSRALVQGHLHDWSGGPGPNDG